MASYPLTDDLQSPRARGKRLKMARKMTGLTRKSLEKKYGISASTLQSWEAVKAGGLTEQGAQRIIFVLHSEGFLCTMDWLLYGKGNSPEPTNLHFPKAQEDPSLHDLPEEIIVEREFSTFKSLHLDVVHLIINDDGMSPHYQLGDLVAGKRRRTLNAIDRLVGLDCIVETASNETLLRRIKPSSCVGYYNLVCVNPNTLVSTPILCECELVSAAPVMWHRRLDIDPIVKEK